MYTLALHLLAGTTKGIEYIIAIVALVGFLFFLKFLRPPEEKR